MLSISNDKFYILLRCIIRYVVNMQWLGFTTKLEEI